MRRALMMTVSFMLLWAIGQSSLADIAGPGGRPRRNPDRRPEPAPQASHPLVITPDDKADVATLHIPKRMLAVRRGDEPGEGGGTSSLLQPGRTIVAGLAMSAAVAGVLMLLRGKRSTRIASMLLVGGALAFGAWSVAVADRAPSPLPAEPDPDEVGGIGCRVVIRIEPTGDTIRLVVPASVLKPEAPAAPSAPPAPSS